MEWCLETAAWGFAAVVSLHVLRMIWAGVFDRLDISYKKSLVSSSFSAARKPIAARRPPSEYFRENFYCTTSGTNWAPTINFMQKVLGSDRVLFAVDYPFEDQPWTIKRAKDTPMSAADRKLFFQTNAEKVFKLV
jgi:5-carboxyvanillate decarboxylase